MAKKTITLDSFEALYAHECPEAAAKKAEAERKAKENERRQKARAQMAKRYKELAEGAAALRRIASSHQSYSSYVEFENHIRAYKPYKSQEALMVLKDMRNMGFESLDEELFDSQMQYYIDSLEDM